MKKLKTLKPITLLNIEFVNSILKNTEALRLEIQRNAQYVTECNNVKTYYVKYDEIDNVTLFVKLRNNIISHGKIK